MIIELRIVLVGMGLTFQKVLRLRPNVSKKFKDLELLVTVTGNLRIKWKFQK